MLAEFWNGGWKAFEGWGIDFQEWRLSFITTVLVSDNEFIKAVLLVAAQSYS
jgi:hypothetical protein